jgi:peroxiredoxin Q/BCP
MRLVAPTHAPDTSLVDIEGQSIRIGGRRMLMSFFREVNCPFCNFRVFELTHNYRVLKERGMEVVVVFSSNAEDVKRFIARQPRPFRMVADPENSAHKRYGVESSFLGKLKAMMLRMPAMLRGMRMVGMAGMATENLMPADFLIDENDKLVEADYGSDAGDHIPIERIELFASRGMAIMGMTDLPMRQIKEARSPIRIN